MTEHTARPTGKWDPDGAGRCATCGGRLIEAVYTGGWMHSTETPHAFEAFVFGDRTKSETAGCLWCVRPPAAAIHSSK